MISLPQINSSTLLRLMDLVDAEGILWDYEDDSGKSKLFFPFENQSEILHNISANFALIF